MEMIMGKLTTAALLECDIGLNTANCLVGGRKNLMEIHSNVIELRDRINKLEPIYAAEREYQDANEGHQLPQELQENYDQVQQVHTRMIEARRSYAKACDDALMNFYNAFWDELETEYGKLQIKRTMLKPTHPGFLEDLAKVLRENAHFSEEKINKLLSSPAGIAEAIEKAARAVNGILEEK